MPDVNALSDPPDQATAAEPPVAELGQLAAGETSEARGRARAELSDDSPDRPNTAGQSQAPPPPGTSAAAQARSSQPTKATPAGSPAHPSANAQGPGVEGAVLPHAAHLRIESEAFGEVELHLRVRDGVAHLRVEGDAAQAMQGHVPELRAALAREGLSLGRLELGSPTATAAPAPAQASSPSADAQRSQELPQEPESEGAQALQQRKRKDPASRSWISRPRKEHA